MVTSVYSIANFTLLWEWTEFIAICYYCIMTKNIQCVFQFQIIAQNIIVKRLSIQIKKQRYLRL